jgi:hypothetical protein
MPLPLVTFNTGIVEDRQREWLAAPSPILSSWTSTRCSSTSLDQSLCKGKMATFAKINDVLLGIMDSVIVRSGAPSRYQFDSLVNCWSKNSTIGCRGSWPPYATRTFGFLVIGCLFIGALVGGGDAANAPKVRHDRR